MTLTPFILGGIAVFVVGRLFASAGEPAAPPPLPAGPLRRQRKRAPKSPPPVAAPEKAPVLAAPVAASAPRVVPPLSPRRVRSAYATRDALRRAIVAQEVFGPPLALRPPRQ